MAKQAWKPRVVAIVVLEFRVVSRRLQRGMSEDYSIICTNKRLRNGVEVISGHRLAAERNVALRANKRGALISLVYFIVENSTFIERRRNVTTFGATA